MTPCILLAGGLGTRLREAVPDVPKCLAPVGEKTFLQIQIEQLACRGIERFILSLGYLAGQVIEVAEKLRSSFGIEWVVEPRQLGTGGAALFTMHHAALSEAVVANGDTFVDADLAALLAPLDRAAEEQIRMLALPSPGGARFGSVVVSGGKAERFLPHGRSSPGLINAGIYRICRDAFGKFRPGEIFSLERDVLARLASQGKVATMATTGTLIDIGVAADYFRFCALFGGSRSQGVAEGSQAMTPSYSQEI